ncbi:CLK4-associating serine/arginine rich protein-like isoform X2 [Olea europaea var. sylvestris]|uniref:CLK4-associating serine/arginine rich protein-like isoform X2 n=1 Tax=Olea europaea var. sylvestris TaxID=158386 RepID=UPI000C1CF032|nr:CLK4-associating serine/arginine rich protein-like isoform X2 [Olea europaea var. sylvestris]
MWHEARRSEKKVHEMMDAARKRAQRRAIYLAKRRGDPSQSIQAVGTRCRINRDEALYQATEDQQGLIPWNGKQDVMIDRFDGRALLDFIRDSSTRRPQVAEKTEEEEELEEFVSFERYRDLIKHRRRGFTDEEGLQHVNQEMEAKISAYFGSHSKSHAAQPPASKGPYSQVGFSYDGDEKEETQDLDGDEDDDDEEDYYEEDFNSDDSNDELMESIAKEFGVKRYGWLVYMDKKAKEEQRRQKEVIKGDPSIKKLSRKERRKVSQMEREKEREAARINGIRVLHHDPYRESRRSPTYEAYSRSRRSRSKSRSYSPSQSRRHAHGSHSDDLHRGKDRAPKIEYITEFGGFDDGDAPKLEGYSPPPSPSSHTDALNRPSSGRILEALHVDPASGVSLDKEKNAKLLKPTTSTSSALAKLSKTTSSGSLSKQQGEKKETPQERLKRIMSSQLNKQIKKDTAIEIAKKREQERQRLKKLAETSHVSRYRRRSHSRSYSRSPPRRYRRSRSPSRGRSSRKYRSSHSQSRSGSRSQTRSRSPSYSYSSRSHSRSCSPRGRRRSRY